MRKQLLFSFAFQLFLLVPASITWAQSVNHRKGLTTALFSTSHGSVKLYLPDDIRAGDMISGTIWAEPAGTTDRLKEKNRETLKGYAVMVEGRNIPISDQPSPFQWLVPAEGKTEMTLALMQVSGNKVSGTVKIPVNKAGETGPLSSGCLPPSHILNGAPFSIPGAFDGDLGNTRCLLNQEAMPILAESPRQCQVMYPENKEGPGTLQVQENGENKCVREVSGVDMQITTGNLNLRKGQSTFIDIKLTGLENLPDKALLTVQNMTPGVVTMTNGNLQAITIWPPEPSQNGVFMLHNPAISTANGNFEVVVDLDLPQAGQTATGTTELPPGYTSKSCQCEAGVSLVRSGNKITATARSACKGQYGVGINTFPMCAVSSVTYEWSVPVGKDNVELVGKKDAKEITIRPLNKKGFTVCVTVTVTCIDGTQCKATDCITDAGEEPPPPPVNKCVCKTSCEVVAGAEKDGETTYTGNVKAACTGTSGAGITQVACSVKSITYRWKLTDDGSGVAIITGKSDGPSVTVKRKKRGSYTISLSGTVTCSDGTTCDFYCNAEVPDYPVPGDKLCQLKPEEKPSPAMDGGLNPAYKVADKVIRRDDFIILGALGEDADILTWKCDPFKPDCPDTKSERSILLNSRVRFSWEITGGEGAFVKLGCLPDAAKTDEGDVVIFKPPVVPFPKKAADTSVTTTVKLSIIDDNPSQPIDPTVERVITIVTRRSKGTPDQYRITVSGPAMKPLDKKLPADLAGTCSAKGPKWEALTPIAPDPPVIQLPAVADNDKMVVGQWMLLQTSDIRDEDKLTLECQSAGGCTTRPWDKNYQDAIDWEWTAKGGGRIVTDPSRQYVIYEAPAEIAKGKDFIEVEFIVKTRNMGGKATEKGNAEGKKKIRVFRAGVKLSHPKPDWLPEDKNSLELTSELMYKDGDWKPALAHMCRIHFFELMNVSKEKGGCMNAPVPKEATPCHDLKLDNQAGIEAFDDKTISGCKTKEIYQQARSAAPVATATIKVYSLDFGAYGFLRSFANVNKGGKDSIRGEKPVYEPVPAHVAHTLRHPQGRAKKNAYNDNRVTVPHDLDENHIADGGWLATGGVRVQDPVQNNADEDETPTGDNYAGDGLTTYEEYRGFYVKEGDAVAHVRTNARVKDIFVHNRDDLDLSLYASVSGLDVHAINENQYVDNNTRVVNANYSRETHLVDQRGLKLINGGTHASLLGIAVSLGALTPTIPNFESEIRVYITRIEQACKKRNITDVAAKKRAVIAHELLHGNNVCHHGEGDESVENSINLVHGLRSGNMSCVMRYDNVGSVIKGYDPEDVGSSLCSSSTGTGYNANGQHFGDSADRRGNCRGQIRVSGRGGRPSSCGNRL